jgi:hypothetical protein
MSPLQRGQRSALWVLAQLLAAASIDCCCVTASAIPIETSLSDPPIYLTPFHNEVQGNSRSRMAPTRPGSSMSLKLQEIERPPFRNLCREENEVPRTICRSDGTMPKGRHEAGTFI